MSAYKQIYETIRAKLCAETELRPRRDLDEWILAERLCVQREVNRLRALRDRPALDLATVERAERTALGHVDYISKYALAAADLVLSDPAR